jgi:hypothetical protein
MAGEMHSQSVSRANKGVSSRLMSLSHTTFGAAGSDRAEGEDQMADLPTVPRYLVRKSAEPGQFDLGQDNSRAGETYARLGHWIVGRAGLVQRRPIVAPIRRDARLGHKGV